LPIGVGPNLKNIAVALKVLGPVTFADQSNMNWFEYYQLSVYNANSNTSSPVSHANNRTNFVFNKPFDYAGEKSFGDASAYETYARSFVYCVNIPGCDASGRVFVGQRRESFHIAIGKVFDLINFIPVPGLPTSIAECNKNNDLRGLNIGTFALEVPLQCLLGTSDVLGAWSTVRQLHHGPNNSHIPGRQTSRLGNPLVNELFVGLHDKDKFSVAVPLDDARLFLNYVTHPTLPAIIDLLFRAALGAPGNIAPSNIPRTDLLTTFLTGFPGLNQPPNVAPSEMMRLNTAIAVTARAEQNQFGVIGGDAAGYPNGRRPGDDVVDISLRVAMGRLCHLPLGLCSPSDAPVGAIDLTDGAPMSALDFDNVFPYLRTPLPGATTDPDPSSCSLACPPPA